MIYWDTSCVVKLYTEESDTSIWEKRALDAKDSLVASTLMRTEMVFALEQKEVRGDICAGAAKALLSQFDYDISKGRFQLIPMGTDVLDMVCDIASKCYHTTPAIYIRTLDGIHLATARLLKCRYIATADVRMKTAASLLGFKLFG